MNTFNKVSYFFLLILAWFSSSYAMGFSGHYVAAFLQLFGVVPDTPYIIVTITQIFIGLIHGLIIFRLIFWFKTKSLCLPELYRGVIAFIGYLSFVFILIVIAVYTSLFSGSVSGIPLGIALVYAGYFSPLPVVICELRELYRCIPMRV